MAKRTFRTIERRPRHKFETEGESVEGFLRKLEPETNRNGTSDVATLVTDDGEIIEFYVTSGMVGLLTEELISRYVLVTYEGETLNPNSGRMFKSFTVQVAE